MKFAVIKKSYCNIHKSQMKKQPRAMAVGNIFYAPLQLNDLAVQDHGRII